jgi:hypothetical protein
MQKVDPPKGEKVDDERGYCTFNPPAVFPMPKQASSLSNVQGQQQMQMVPMMIRPVVEGKEPMCGRFSPDEETMKELGLDKPDKSGCSGGGCEK